MLKISSQILAGVLVFILALNGLIEMAVVEKPFYARLYHTAIGAFAGGGIGVLAGVVIGGVGVVMMGTGIGLAGAALFGVAGFGLGALGGSLWTIITNTEMYQVDCTKLIIVIVASFLLAVVAAVFLGRIFSLFFPPPPKKKKMNNVHE